MHLALTPEVEAFRDELRAYFTELMTPERLHGLAYSDASGEVYRDAARQMGRDGKLGIGWPVEYGGQGRSPLEQFIWFDEAERAYAPTLLVTLNTVGPTLMANGTEEQQARFLPGILAGEIHFAIGYTEADAGTDLASLRTRAVRDGDRYVVDGAKVFTTGGDLADFVWLACRTDPDAPKHKGISMIVVPTSSPGFSFTPIVTVGGVVTTATYYEDVRVPVANRIGEEHQGWRMITTQLNHERVGLAALGAMAHRLWDEVSAWARETGAIDQPWVQADLARTFAKLEAMKLLNWRMAAAIGAGELKPADSSAVKVYGTETLVDVYRTLLAVLGPVGYLPDGSPGAVLQGRLEKAARSAQINTFGGGVNDVQRDIIAAAGLGMARSAR